MKFIKKLALFFILLNPLISTGQLLEIKGIIIDENEQPIHLVNVLTPDNKYFTQSDSSGNFNISIPKSYKNLVFTYSIIDPVTIDLPELNDNIFIKVKLNLSNEIDVVIIEADKINSVGIISIDAKISTVLPSINESVESIIKSQGMGVTGSRNELSSKYSVRGGSFDENSVYVNGIEIYRPQLVRSGQQEGLSFINPKMISDAKFSSGGFEAKYGSKMSSVLDVTYKQVRNEEFSASMSFLGGSVHYQNLSKNKKFSHVSGIRYKTTKYLLKSLETSGDYEPKFADFQTYLTYYFNPKWDINFLANISDNSFMYYPESGETNFGSIEKLYSLFVTYFGQEIDHFFNHTENISINYHPQKNLNFSFFTSYLFAKESETFDIIGIYDLNQLNKDISQGSAGDSILNIGYGAYMDHARNDLSIRGINSGISSYYKSGKHYLSWGINYKYEQINDKIDEWTLEDSASYIIPVNYSELTLKDNVKSRNNIINNRYSLYLQDKLNLESAFFQYEITGGIRTDYSSFSDELLFSPRFATAIRFLDNNNHIIRFSSGLYYQPVFYREIRNFDGSLTNDKSAQKSLHFVLGHNFKFKALGRNFKLYTELYYKQLDNIIPYEVDNVRIRYYTDVRTTGYATGIDTKIIGDFVQGIDSWFSLSVLKTSEKLNVNNNFIDTSYFIARPTDQRVTAALFVQDYFPGNKNFKAFLNLVFGTGFPFGYPKEIENKAIYRSYPYHRVDLGASAVLIGEGRTTGSRFLNKLNSVWFTVEIFNLLDIKNTVSYRWIHVVPNSSVSANEVLNNFPIPVNLTGRIFNLKLTINI
jgi:hypothetical protein